MKIKLKILKKDILLDNYMDYENCPITKAFKRAGYYDIEDSGVLYISGIRITTLNNKSYATLVKNYMECIIH